ncbi:hypothetical protein [Nocardia salmonicida]|uniref:hypothetical protein n=1 Tax=Nocardia salmonicida TaxID=53431 RepID=UPI0037B23256
MGLWDKVKSVFDDDEDEKKVSEPPKSSAPVVSAQSSANAAERATGAAENGPTGNPVLNALTGDAPVPEQSAEAGGLLDVVSLVNQSEKLESGETVTLPSGTQVDQERTDVGNGLYSETPSVRLPSGEWVKDPAGTSAKPQHFVLPALMAGAIGTDENYSKEQRDRDIALVVAARTAPVVGDYYGALDRLNSHYVPGSIVGPSGDMFTPSRDYSAVDILGDLATSATVGELDELSSQKRAAALDRLANSSNRYSAQQQDEDQKAAHLQYGSAYGGASDEVREARIRELMGVGYTRERALQQLNANALAARDRLNAHGIGVDPARATELESNKYGSLYPTDPRTTYIPNSVLNPHKFDFGDARNVVGGILDAMIMDHAENLVTGLQEDNYGKALWGATNMFTLGLPAAAVDSSVQVYDGVTEGDWGKIRNGTLGLGLAILPYPILRFYGKAWAAAGAEVEAAILLERLAAAEGVTGLGAAEAAIEAGRRAGLGTVPRSGGTAGEAVAPHTPLTTTPRHIPEYPAGTQSGAPRPGATNPWDSRVDPAGIDGPTIDGLSIFPTRPRPGANIPQRGPGQHGGGTAAGGTPKAPARGSDGDLVLQVDELYQQAGMRESEIIARLGGQGLTDDQIRAVIAASDHLPSLLKPGQWIDSNGKIHNPGGHFAGAADLPGGKNPMTLAPDPRPSAAEMKALERATELDNTQRFGMTPTPAGRPSPWNTAGLGDTGNVGAIGGRIGERLTRTKLEADGYVIIAEGADARIPIPGKPGRYFEPDFIVVKDGKVSFVESKWGDGAYTRGQLEGYEAYRQGGQQLLIDDIQNAELRGLFRERKLDPSQIQVDGVTTIRWNNGWQATDDLVWQAANEPWPTSLLRTDGNWNQSLPAFAELNAEAARRAALANNPAAYLYFQARSEALLAVQALRPSRTAAQNALAAAVDDFSQRAATLLGGPPMVPGDAMRSLGFISDAETAPVVPNLAAPVNTAIADLTQAGQRNRMGRRVDQSLTVQISMTQLNGGAVSRGEELSELTMLGR